MRRRNAAAVTLACVAASGVVMTMVGASGAGNTELYTSTGTSTPAVTADILVRPSGQPLVVETRQERKKSVKTRTSIKTKKKVFFVTIDDGNVKNRAALKYVKKTKMPVTVFLTHSVVGNAWGYFRKMAAHGGSVENHTMTHKSLPSLSAAALRSEICKPQRIYRKKFGTAPTMLRPPYGNGAYPYDPSSVKRRIATAAASCGIDRIAMWNVVVGSGKVEYARAPLRRGDIVLLHFGPNLANELKMVRKLGKRQGLRPAPLQKFI